MARPVGSKNRPQFYTYVTEIERVEFVKWVKENFKKDANLARWYGEQMFGKAPQPLTNSEGGDLPVPIVNLNVQRNNSNEEDSQS